MMVDAVPLSKSFQTSPCISSIATDLRISIIVAAVELNSYPLHSALHCIGSSSLLDVIIEALSLESTDGADSDHSMLWFEDGASLR